MAFKQDVLQSSALSIQLIYRMSGLHGTLHCLQEICAEALPVHRINALYIPADMSVIINMGDTLQLAPTTVRRPGQDPPIVLWQKTGEPLVVGNLDEFKSEPLKSDPASADIPFLQYGALARIPLCQTANFTFVLNFWSREYQAFSEADLLDLQLLTAPLAEGLKATLGTGLNIQPTAPPPKTSRERLFMCTGLAEVRCMVEQVAGTSSTVLITGETGVGKEAVADAIHELSPRRNGPMIKVNCGAIPESLLDSELFGYEKGAFTGAAMSRRGYFEAAHGGTIVLDEIGEMSLQAQIRLLRVLDSGFVTRVGNPTPLPLDVRVIAATHADLRARVLEGSFRKDLWYRLSVFPIEVPPLRQRKEDIPVLVRHFIHSKAKSLRCKHPLRLPEAAMATLYRHDWPGNVRELEHVVERAMIRGGGPHGEVHFEIDPLGSPQDSPQPCVAGGDWPTLEQLKNRYIRDVLEYCGGKLTGKGGASEVLGIHYTTLRTHMKQLDLPLPREPHAEPLPKGLPQN